MSKPPLPKGGVPVKIHAEIQASMDRDPDRYRNSYLRFKFSDTTVEVTDDDGKVQGSVYAAIGGGLGAEVNGRIYFLRVEQLWQLFNQLDAAYMANRDGVMFTFKEPSHAPENPQGPSAEGVS